MQSESIFQWLGKAAGSVIRFLADALMAVIGGVGRVLNDFFNGLARAVGMDPTAFHFALLLLGLLFLYVGVRAFMRHSILAGIFWLVIAAFVLSSVIH